MGISVQRDDLNINATFLQMPNGDFAGHALLQVGDLSLGALGAYGEYLGHPSLFLYAFIDYPLGGPAFFFVEGVAAGFGYNRRLSVPPVAELYRFPLISEVAGTTSPPAGLNGSSPPDPSGVILQELTTLETYVAPEVGQYFLAMGLRFSTFQLVDTFALLTLSAGNQLEIDLMGISTAIVPTPEDGETVTPLAEAQLQGAAKFIPAEGALSAQAQLTPTSFILSSQCHLQGGFAFASWFAGPNAGQFVYTYGGYHPDFQAPSYYPQVPRLGLNWLVSRQTQIKGMAYYALTASAVMAGGWLSATAELDTVKAWFSAGVNVLMAWKPYHYEGSANVEVGAQLTIRFFGTHYVNIRAGAVVNFWGPEFAGNVSVNVKVIGINVHFSVDLGNSSHARPPKLSWDRFQSSFLPTSDKICSVSVQGGLKRTLTDADGTPRWVVNAKDFALVTDSMVPAMGSNDHGIGFVDARPLDSGTPSALPTGRAETLGGASSFTNWACMGTDTPFGIDPMRVEPSQLESIQLVQITRDGSNAKAAFRFCPVRKAVPKALWNPAATPLSEPQLNATEMTQAVTGALLTPATPATPGVSTSIERGSLSYEVTVQPLTDDPAKMSYTPSTSTLSASWVDATTQTNRDDLLSAMGFDPAVMVDLSETLPKAFVDEPQLVQAGFPTGSA